jgi:hippurate hydrolase
MENSLSQNFLDELITFRKQLHRKPEIGFNVKGTADLISETLRNAGLEVSRDIGTNGVVASLNRGSGVDPVGLRADMDALPIHEANNFAHASVHPGKFHGCGHDGHATMLLGAALHLSRQESFEREIHFIFQPDEENGNGARAMIESGLFEDFKMDAVYGLHNLPGLSVGEFAIQSGAFCSFEDNFEIKIIGRGGHSSMPEKLIDPIVIGAKIVTDIQTIVSRTISPSDHAVVSVTNFETDGARNVIASKVKITGDCRGFEVHISESIQSRMNAIVANNCASYDADFSFSYLTSFVPLLNSEAHTELCAKVADKISGACVRSDFGRVGFSEDFAQMLKVKPGAYILMGNGRGIGNYSEPLHCPNYDFNDAAIRFGVEYWCAVANAGKVSLPSTLISD